jgi:glycosyltransferase involved in cell wall biosynthesis
LILGDIESQREIWGDAALYVAPSDAAALESSARRLAADPALRLELAERARERARRYSVSRMTSAYLAIYTRLIAERSARSLASMLAARRAVTKPCRALRLVGDER